MNIEITALKKPPPCRIIGSIRFSTDHKALEIYNNEAFPPNFKHCITDGQPVHRRIRVKKRARPERKAPSCPLFHISNYASLGAFFIQTWASFFSPFRVLSHDPDQGMGYIQFFQVSHLLGRQLQVYGPCRTFYMVKFGRSGNGAVTFDSSHAREISVIVTPRFSANSATRSIMPSSAEAI